MSHTVNIKMIASQEINIHGYVVNIHDIRTIVVNSRGRIESVFCECEHCDSGWNIHYHTGEGEIKCFRKVR